MNYKFGSEEFKIRREQKIVVLALCGNMIIGTTLFFVVSWLKKEPVFLYVIPFIIVSSLLGLAVILNTRQLVFLSINETKMMLCANNMLNQKKYYDITHSDFSFDIKTSKSSKSPMRMLRLYSNGKLLTRYSLAPVENDEKPEAVELLKKLEEFKAGK